jgi:hypothetical protein
MHLKRLFSLALVAVAFAACGDDDESTAPEERYVIALTGAAERPTPVVTTGSGSAIVTVHSPDSIEYDLSVVGLDSITASHFHAGAADAAGPVMHFVFAGPTTGLGFTGRLSSGFVTRASKFSGAFTFDSLLTRIRAGTTYLNVHTRKNQAGEIRGQVTP